MLHHKKNQSKKINNRCKKYKVGNKKCGSVFLNNERNDKDKCCCSPQQRHQAYEINLFLIQMEMYV